MKKTFKLPSVLIAAGILALVLLCAYAIHQGKREAYAKVQPTFEKVIDADCLNRLGVTKHSLNPLGRKIKRMEIITEKGVETVEFEDSVEESIANQQMMQYGMLEVNPLQPDTFNTLLKQALAERGISAEATGIIYQYKDKKQYSGNDSTGMQSAFVTEATYIDIKQEASVQAWVKCSLSTIISHIPDRLRYAILTCIAIVVGTFIYVMVKRMQNKQKSLHQALVVENEQHKAKEAGRAAYEKDLFGNTRQFEGMTLYERTRTIHADGISRALSPKEFRLLWMFVTAPENTLYGKDIQETFWPENEMAQNNRGVLIKTLRNSLQAFPYYQLKTLKGHKFKLERGKKNNKRPAAD